MAEEKAWELLILKLSGDATPEQEAELDELLKNSPELALKATMIEQVWKNKTVLPTQYTEDNYNKLLQKLSNDATHERPPAATAPVRQKTRRLGLVKRLAVAAAVAAVVVSIFLWQPTYVKEKPLAKAEGIVSTKNGSKSKVQLPDGTQVFLNSGSTITYGKDFNDALREISLTGEAFFDVVKDSNRPFIIHTQTVNIKVIGTAFNVRSYPEEKNTETSLIRGSVEVSFRNNPDKKVVLKPNEKLVVKNDSLLVEHTITPAVGGKNTPIMTLTTVRLSESDSAAVETLWTKNKLAFEDETLEQVARKLEHWYDVKVTINSEYLKNTEYTAVFDDESLPEVLYALQLSGNFRYQIKKKEIIISP
jgi:transmembrane sensor